jgi:hypothetical protein
MLKMIAAEVKTTFGSAYQCLIRVLDFTDTQLAQIQKQYPIWNRFVIKAGT